MSFFLGIQVDNGAIVLRRSESTDTTPTSHRPFSIDSANGPLYFFPQSKHPFWTTLGSTIARAVERCELGQDKLNEIASQAAGLSSLQMQKDDGGVPEAREYALLGGRMGLDQQHQMYRIGSDGSIEAIGRRIPYWMSGPAGIGSRLISKILAADTSLNSGLNLGLQVLKQHQKFGSTAGNVIEVMLYRADNQQISYRQEPLQTIKSADLMQRVWRNAPQPVSIY